MLRIETGLVLLALLIAFIRPSLGNSWFEKWERCFSALSRRRALSVFLVGVGALGLRLAVLPVEPIPKPALDDEFSYLLMGDTFAHGRLTNPTHPMWVHFETFHINQKPTYCSAYYPAQGVFLALGQAVFGHPFWGVWLSCGLMCAAFCWALQAWIPSSWSLLGGILCIVRLATFSYWGNSYWGGAVAAFGGALLLGAFPRIKRRLLLRDALAFGVGLAILVNSRPYESIFYAVPVVIALLCSASKPHLRRIRTLWLPLAALLVLTLSAMGYYFAKCTGSALEIPYVVNQRAYEVVQPFPWQHLRPLPAYNHAAMKDFYTGWQLQQYQEARRAPIPNLFAKFVKGGLFFGGVAFWTPWLVLVFVLPYGVSIRQLGPRTGLLAGFCIASLIGMALPMYYGFESHYAAPICCAFYALEMQVMRKLRLWDFRTTRKGAAIVRNLVAICILLFLLRAGAGCLHVSPREFALTWSGPRIENLARARISDSLAAQAGRHLVVVRYAPDHRGRAEWVYNSADIDNSRIVWARDMGAKNLELIRYFRDRRVWLLKPDETPPLLSPYDDEVSRADGGQNAEQIKVY